MFKAINSESKAHGVRIDAGAHDFTKPQKDLPMGIAPAVARFQHEAVTKGYYLNS